MKIVDFILPVAKENSVVVQEDKTPHFYTYLHRHNETQITWILKGKGTLIVDDYMQSFKEGDVYVIGANQPHIFKSDESYFNTNNKKSVHALSLFFNSDGFFKPILELPELTLIKKFVDETVYGMQLQESKANKIIAEMLAVKNASHGMKLAAFIRLLQTMANIEEWKKLTSLSSQDLNADVSKMRINDVIKFTANNYSKKIKLKEVAEIAFLTPHAFCRYFKKHTRKQYFSFLNEIRVSEACKKIVSGNYSSISAVAKDTGFASAVNFNRVFKKITSKSPKEYLKEYQHTL